MTATLTELRMELLHQHDKIRALAKAIAATAEVVSRDSTVLPVLISLLGTFLREVREHNHFETESLHGILPRIDAWGPLRDRLMGRHHIEEHVALVAAIHDAGHATDPTVAAQTTLRVLTEIEAHMQREERELFSPDVLKDDLITSGVGG